MDMDSFHIHYEISVDYSTEESLGLSGIPHLPVCDKSSVKPGTSVSTDFVRISSVRS